MYKVAQMNFTPEVQVFYMLIERPLSIFSMTSLKNHIEYFHFRCKILLDLNLPVLMFLVYVRYIISVMPKVMQYSSTINLYQHCRY